MIQRIITGVISAALLILIVFMRGVVFDVVISLAALLGCFEMIKAFRQANINPAKEPIYLAALLMLPAYLLLGVSSIYLLSAAATLLVMLRIALGKDPRWKDAAASLNVLISVPVPLMMLYPIIRVEPLELGALLAFSVFVIALLGDTFAYFVGVTMGSHRMAPEVSPKKTWEGAAGGLMGSVAGAMLLCLAGRTVTAMPPLWHFFFLGLIGGVAGQLGDLSASLVKRFCGVKDYGTMFPGHGGMMDRLDSIIFVCFVLFGYCMAAGLL